MQKGFNMTLLESWLTAYKGSAPTRRAARLQAAHRPRPQRPTPPLAEPRRFTGSHFQRLRLLHHTATMTDRTDGGN